MSVSTPIPADAGVVGVRPTASSKRTGRVDDRKRTAEASCSRRTLALTA